MLGICYLSKDDLTDNARSNVHGLSFDDLVCDGVSQIRDLTDSEIPHGPIEVLDSDDRLDLIGTPLQVLGRLHLLRDDHLKLE